MPKITDTYARVYGCCDAVFTERGRFPTLDLIRERIGVNSPTTIKKAMNEWKRHFDQLNRSDVPVALAHAMEQAILEAEKAFFNQTLVRARGQTAEGMQKIRALRQQLETQAPELLQVAGQLADTEKQLADQ